MDSIGGRDKRLLTIDLRHESSARPQHEQLKDLLVKQMLTGRTFARRWPLFVPPGIISQNVSGPVNGYKSRSFTNFQNDTLASLSGNHESPKGRQHEKQALGQPVNSIGRDLIPYLFSMFRTFVFL
jgi:hypothetical protein